ncbi:AAA family ATPase [Mycoplasma sp. 4404]|uniref:AAA family ATPase n=1 Tax=Mycoplasma sp. 4404 TaxID=3108530 RepID=UPI002B1D2E5F|nr:AAA family ATPase [Mycoplasma sp. 4404]MEA4162885.1 AAA family ATPase [Mycoplasma sp. 4404]
MKLVKIEAHGFKSFAEPVILRFDGGVAGIIGPNGSGKSNINDAIKWVLGEQSSKELRGDSMQDVIFAGSKTAKPMDFARVTLTFDNKNSNNSIPDEVVTITRELQRGKGVNNYYMNGQPCRYKDIKSIAMETGIGKSSLAIISQGTVSDIAEASDEDRRGIFEEAAGVSKFKFKKTESERMLKSAEDSMNQLEPRISELEKQLGPLRKQAEKALIYRDKAEALKKVEIPFLAKGIKENKRIYEELDEELRGVDETMQKYKEEIASLQIEIKNAKVEKEKARQQVDELEGTYNGMASRLNSLNSTIDQQFAKINLITSGQVTVDNDEAIKSYASAIKRLEAELLYNTHTYGELKAQFEETRKQIEEDTNLVNNLRIANQNHRDNLISAKTTLQSLYRTKESKLNLFKGPKTIMENKMSFKGVKGLVRDLIKVKPEYITAIETVLTHAAQHIVVDIPNTAVKAVEFLKQNNGGRATFIPLTSIQEKFVRDDYLLAVTGHPGFVALASDLVDADPQYSVLVKFLLGNVVVVDDIKSANAISNLLEKKYMIVTLDGDIIRVGGVIVGGTAQESDNVLGIDEKIANLENKIAGIEPMIKKNEQQIEQLSFRRNQLIQKSRSTELEIHNLENSIKQKREEVTNLKGKVDASSLSLDDFENSETVIERNKLQAKLIVVKNELAVAKNLYQSWDEALSLYNTKLSDAQDSQNALNKGYSSKMINKSESFKIFTEYTNRLANVYHMTVEYADQNFVLEISYEKAKEFVEELRQQIAELGNVNLESIEQLEEVENRYDTLVANRDELIQTRDTLYQAIAELDKIIVTRLTNVVHDVNQEFNNVFKSMFGGGAAEVRFVEPNNILESGISIFAQPPGKSVKNLKLFSGGEKALIAISLLFAILRARPLPLCILDEVEAALDEANVVRYAEYLQELKKQTQFIVITHRTGTMQRVDSLFAATMQTRGITSFFSIHLKDVEKYITEEAN